MKKLVLQADVEGSLDIVLKEARPKMDEHGNKRIGKKDHAVLLCIPGFRGNRKLIIDNDNAPGLGVGSVKEFFRVLQTHPGPSNGDFTYTAVLDNFKFQEIETMTYEEILKEIEDRTGIPPIRRQLTKALGILALRRLRRLADQEKPSPVVPVTTQETNGGADQATGTN